MLGVPISPPRTYWFEIRTNFWPERDSATLWVVNVTQRP